jgi:UDP-N-acetylmuramate dehydrogenase
VWTPEGSARWLEQGQWRAGYRDFDPGPGLCRDFCLVWSAELALEPDDPSGIRVRMREITERKAATQPVREATAGSVFKNPRDRSAGLLLDSLGFKGRVRGGMKFSEMHANFLINTGSGTSSEALELLDEAREAVRKAYGLELELEVKVVE